MEEKRDEDGDRGQSKTCEPVSKRHFCWEIVSVIWPRGVGIGYVITAAHGDQPFSFPEPETLIHFRHTQRGKPVDVGLHLSLPTASMMLDTSELILRILHDKDTSGRWGHLQLQTGALNSSVGLNSQLVLLLTSQLTLPFETPKWQRLHPTSWSRPDQLPCRGQRGTRNYSLQLQ